MKVTKEVVAGFVGGVLASRFETPSASPNWHHEAWELCCSDFPRVAISAPRGHAKSSAITLGYGLATLLFRERKFMLLVSDTESQAALFLGSIKAELTENEYLIDLFDLKKNDKGQVVFVKETENDIILEFNDGHKFRIIAKGAEQKLRGLIWNGSRPDIVICDDMENDEAVINKDRREKLRRWFYSALLPVISSTGIVRVVGTILHMDSLLERLMPENQLIGHARKTELIELPLKTYTNRRTPWKSVKYKAHVGNHPNEIQSKEDILWGDRYTKPYFMSKYEDYALQGITDAYSQEMLNVPLDLTTTYFRRNDFIPMTKEDRDKLVNFYMTVDLAISQREQADYSVFLIAGVDENRRLHIVDVIKERLDGKDIVDTILALERAYKFEAIGIEDMQVSKSIGPFLLEEMTAQNVYPTLYKLKHGGKDKITRSRSIQARMRAHSIRFDKEGDWYPGFEDELLKFPRDKHDDQVDAFAYLGLMLDKLLEAPTKEEQEEEEYFDELRESNSGSGRSRITGY